jgi:L-glutamine-phosphate cytidylyltransferase
MRAIIIAAGKGTRLFPLTKNTPKSLIEVGNGITMLESQLHSLKENGVKDVTIIIGYKAEQIEAKIKKYSNDFNINTVYNPFYETSNNLVSVWMAKHFMQEDFITINGDDIFKPVVIENLLKSEHNITMVIDEKPEYDDDDMKVVHKNGLVQQVSKKIPAGEANGESVGIIKFTGKGRQIYIDTLEEMVRDEENMNAFYLKAIQQIINKGYQVNFSMCKADDWGELDFHPDLVMIKQYLRRSNLLDTIFPNKE